MVAIKKCRKGRTVTHGLARRPLAVAVGGMLLSVSAVHAQETRVAALEEIVVTAQKRAELVQDVPISLSVFDASDLDNIGVFSIGDLRTSVPSLQLRPFFTAQQSLTPFIRGIGNGFVDIFQDPSVAVHLNGVYIARTNGMDFDIADLERVEILKGPQGSLYGRNSTGGAINIVTRRPHDQFEFTQRFSVGNYSLFSSRTSVNLPVTDDLAAKISYSYSERDGYIRNTRSSNNFGDRENHSLRFDLRWTPSRNVAIDYSFDWTEISYYTTPPQSLAANPGGLGSDLVDHNTRFQSRLDPGFDLRESEVKQYGHSLSIDWEMDLFTLRSITAVRSLDESYLDGIIGNGNGFRIDSGAVDVFGEFQLPASFTDTEQDQFSQEFQLIGEIGQDIEYVLGVYYFRETSKSGKPFGHQVTAPNGAAPGIDLISLFGRDGKAKNVSTAVFGEMTWTPNALDRRMDVILGARFSRDRRSAELSLYSENWLSMAPFPPFNSFAPTMISSSGFDARSSETFSEFTPSLTLRYHWAHNLMTYAKVVQGYKSGGYNVRAPSAESFVQGFDPETIISYELGMKADWLENRLRTNAAIFYYDYDDMQLTVGVDPAQPSLFNILNAGESRIIGAEFDISAAITPDLTISANYTHLDKDLKKVQDGVGADVTEQYTLGYIPRHAFNISVDYVVSQVRFGELAFNVRYDYVDEMDNANLRQAVREGAVSDSVKLWNARARLSEIPAMGGMFEVAVWGKNLTNRKYVGVATGEPPHSRRSVIWAEPRTYGLDVKFQY